MKRVTFRAKVERILRWAKAWSSLHATKARLASRRRVKAARQTGLPDTGGNGPLLPALPLPNCAPSSDPLAAIRFKILAVVDELPPGYWDLALHQLRELRRQASDYTGNDAVSVPIQDARSPLVASDEHIGSLEPMTNAQFLWMATLVLVFMLVAVPVWVIITVLWLPLDLLAILLRRPIQRPVSSATWQLVKELADLRK